MSIRVDHLYDFILKIYVSALKIFKECYSDKNWSSHLLLINFQLYSGDQIRFLCYQQMNIGAQFVWWTHIQFFTTDKTRMP